MQLLNKYFYVANTGNIISIYLYSLLQQLKNDIEGGDIKMPQNIFKIYD